jgi:hypothetical protein
MRNMAIGLMSALVAVLLAACGGGGDAGTKSDPSRLNTGAARAAVRLVVDGDGIGSVRFGQSPGVVAARLGRPFGPPVGATQIPHGYIRTACGFYGEVWNGLGASSDGLFFVAELTAWFRHARFVGYSYGPNNFQTMLNTWNQYASHPMMIATATGLAVGDPLTHGRRLYGRTFVLTTQRQGTPPSPRLMPLPVWQASMPSGRIEGGIGITNVVDDANSTSKWTMRHRSIVGIGAGMAPNTPC